MNGFGGSQVLAATRVPPYLRSFLAKTGELGLGRWRRRRNRMEASMKLIDTHLWLLAHVSLLRL
jgi:hypothetical protein